MWARALRNPPIPIQPRHPSTPTLREKKSGPQPLTFPEGFSGFFPDIVAAFHFYSGLAVCPSDSAIA